MRLSKAQQNLLDAMKADTIVYHVTGRDGRDFYFRGDTYQRCTSTLLALLRGGLVEEFSTALYKKKYRYKKQEVVQDV